MNNENPTIGELLLWIALWAALIGLLFVAMHFDLSLPQ